MQILQQGRASNYLLLRSLSMNLTEIPIGNSTSIIDIENLLADYRRFIFKNNPTDNLSFVTILYISEQNLYQVKPYIKSPIQYKVSNIHYLGMFRDNLTHLVTDSFECDKDYRKLTKNEIAIVHKADFNILCLS